MKILIVAATIAEINPLFSKMGILPQPHAGIHEGHFKNLKVDILITGIGMTATAYYLGKHLPSFYQMAFNAGIAGAFDKTMALGTVVNISSDLFADLGIEEKGQFQTLSECGLQDASAFPYTNDGLHNSNFPDLETLKSLPKLKGITVNTVSGSETGIGKVVHKFDPEAESMEGASFLFACMLNRIPCAQIRCISNHVEVRNKTAWNIPKAVHNLNIVLTDILEELAASYANI
jgi:futalosine hydrolase